MLRKQREEGGKGGTGSREARAPLEAKRRRERLPPGRLRNAALASVRSYGEMTRVYCY